MKEIQSFQYPLRYYNREDLDNHAFCSRLARSW